MSLDSGAGAVHLGNFAQVSAFARKLHICFVDIIRNAKVGYFEWSEWYSNNFSTKKGYQYPFH